MATNAQKTVDWAEDGEPDLATAIPAPQVSKNKDGTETVVTIFINEDGKKVKRTQRIRRTVVKKKENPRVAERRFESTHLSLNELEAARRHEVAMLADAQLGHVLLRLETL